MNTNESNGSPTQGVEESADVKDLQNVKRWTKRDLGACIAFLQAVYQDPELCDMLATALHGRVLNFKNRPDPNQADLFPKRG